MLGSQEAAKETEMYEGLVVELAGLLASPELNGVKVTCARPSEISADRWVVRLPSGKTANAALRNIRRLDQPGAEPPGTAPLAGTAATPLRVPGEVPSKAMVEARNLAHLPYADWCEVCVAAKGRA